MRIEGNIIDYRQYSETAFLINIVQNLKAQFNGECAFYLLDICGVSNRPILVNGHGCSMLGFEDMITNQNDLLTWTGEEIIMGGFN
jgi:hypothetical protein